MNAMVFKFAKKIANGKRKYKNKNTHGFSKINICMDVMYYLLFMIFWSRIDAIN